MDPEPVPALPLKCLRCGTPNPQQAHCGKCGSPLDLDRFVSTAIDDKLTALMRDRSLVESEVSIRAFERSFGWLKIILAIVSGLVAILSVFGIYKYVDLHSFFQDVKKEISSNQADVQRGFDHIRSEMDGLSETTRTSVNIAAGNAVKEVRKIESEAREVGGTLRTQATEVQRDVAKLQGQVAGAAKLESEMRILRKELEQATIEIDRQRQLLSSQELFVKNIFSSHRTVFFSGKGTEPDFMVLKGASKFVHVLLLLEESPIPETVQLQWHTALQPRNSYSIINNLIIFNWSDPAERLLTRPLTVMYFPDRTNTQKFKTLSIKEGRPYVDEKEIKLK